MRRKLTILAVTAVSALTAAGIAAGAVTFDSTAGTGFVGKGDVQLALGLNNAGLQALGNPAFEYQATSTTVTEVAWVCSNDRNENTQERERTTTTESSTQGVVSSIARVKNQITGFNLIGYDGDPDISSSSETEGNPLNSCPSGPWTLTTPAGDPQEILSESTGGLYVNDVLIP